MHKQMDPNFVPCTFLRSSFFFLLIKRRRIGEWQEKVQERERNKKNKGKPI